MKKNYIIIVLIILIVFISISLFFKPNLRDFSILDTKYTKLMIVAHPDDEVMWGFSELLNNDYLVVCITCGSNTKRVREFIKVMEYTNDDYIMLNYPDKVNGERTDWKDDYNYIVNDIERIIDYKDWDIIVTHNPKGEYGHIHHKITSNIVTNISNKDKLMYFGKYYKKNKVPNNLKKIEENILTKKKYIIDNVYKTQKTVLYGMEHIFMYEDLIAYKEWGELYD